MEVNKKNILVCPLNWGLGHAARCVPIIRELVSQGAMPIIAADEGPLELLQQEFPKLAYIRFPGVPVRYPLPGESMMWSMMKQAPGLLNGISAESKFIENIIEEKRIDAVISDNRFGAFSQKVPSVYITHQIHIQTGYWLTDALARKQHGRYMRNFQTVWIPDFDAEENLSGKLSHGNNIPAHAKYIGILNRLDQIYTDKKKYDVAFILSGPEPQRSILEVGCIEQAAQFPDKKFMLVSGKNCPSVEVPENMDRIPMTDSKTIEKIYATSENIVCRSGYTSLMEMASVGRSAWIIPTPGQTEQEYLADYLAGRMGFRTMGQDSFSLHEVFENPISHSHTSKYNNHLLTEAVSKLLDSIKKANP